MKHRLSVGVLMPGFSSDARDWAIPVQLNLAREQAQHVDYRILALRYPHRQDRYTVAGAEVHSLGYGAWTRGVKRFALWIDAMRTLNAMHRERPFDVLHAMWADETGLIAGWFGKRENIPVVVSVNGSELASLPDLGYGGQLTRFSRWITDRALANAARVIVPSGYIHDLLANHAPHSIPKTVIIPFGVDATRFTPTDLYDPRRLICVASLIPIKDHDTLLRAVARLNDVSLNLIGEGALKATLERRARELGIADRVHFVGAVAHEDLPAHYQRAALHVLASRHETFALSIAEAAACGVPSVTTHVGMLPDFPTIGLTVPISDDVALADAIRVMLDDPQRLAAYRKSARAVVERELTIPYVAARLRHLYAMLG